MPSILYAFHFTFASHSFFYSLSLPVSFSHCCCIFPEFFQFSAHVASCSPAVCVSLLTDMSPGYWGNFPHYQLSLYKLFDLSDFFTMAIFVLVFRLVFDSCLTWTAGALDNLTVKSISLQKEKTNFIVCKSKLFYQCWEMANINRFEDLKLQSLWGNKAKATWKYAAH